MNNLPFVSIIIPCRNEEMFINRCLDSIFAQDYPKDKMEVIIIDGASTDKTREIIELKKKEYNFVKLFDNYQKITPISLNVGIKNARGEIVIRIDAHAYYEASYISKCVKYLNEYKADNVGGVWKTVPANNTFIAKAIAFALSSSFGSGNAYYRTGEAEKSKIVDTVPFGCYRKEIFKKIGFFNENLVRSQDWEFNLRLKKAGGKIVLIPDISITYYPKFTLKDFLIHNFRDGFWIIYPYKFVNIPFNSRHYIPMFFICVLLLTAFLGIIFHNYLPFLLIILVYSLTSFYFSAKISMHEKEPIYLFLLPLVFFIRHIGFGVGTLWGGVRLLFKH